MFKKIAAFLIVLIGIGGAAFASQHPAPAVASSMIASTGSGGNYYYLFVPDHSASARVRVIRGWNSAVGGVTAKDVGSISVSGGVYGIAVNSNVSKLYVSIAGGTPSVNVYDISYTNPDSPTFTLKSTITGFTYPMGVALSRDNKYLYVVDEGAKAVKIVDTATNTIVGSISVGGSNLLAVAVNPDNNHLAVSRNLSPGAVYIYDISSVPTTIPTTPLYTVTSGMDEPTYLSYSSDGVMLYVKVNQKSGNYNDLIGLNVKGSTSYIIIPGVAVPETKYYSIGASLSLVQANEEHPKNKWDGFAVSPTDNFIYLTHYRTSIDPLLTTDDGIYGYVIKTKNTLGINKVYTDVDKNDEDDNGLGWLLTSFKAIPYNEGLDSVVSAPNGGRVWASDSVHGYVISVDSGTGYNPGGVLNTPPSAVSNMQIENPVTAPKLKWSAAIDDGKVSSTLTYVIEYKTQLNDVWDTSLGNTTSLERDLSSLTTGTTYYFRIKAYDGGDAGTWTAGWFGPYAVIGPVAVGTTAGGQTPSISYVTPNAAPNSADITVSITGLNFESGSTVTLKKSGETDISGTVTFNSATSLSVLLPIKSKTVGKWDVVVTNTVNKSDTLTSGFTILNSTDPVAQILDDFEGVAVDPSTGYTAFTKGGTFTTYAPTTTEKYEGAKSMDVSFPASNDKYRGYKGYLKKMQDISSFSHIMVMVKSADTSGTELKVQLTDSSGKNFAAVDSSGVQATKIPSANTTWTQYTIPISSFVEIGSDSKPVAGGAAMKTKEITNYQVVFTGGSASTASIYVDLVAATGGSVVVPGQATFSLYYLTTGNSNWISTPFVITSTMDDTVELGKEVAKNITAAEGDSILVHKWDASKQQVKTTTGDYDSTKGWVWDTAGDALNAGEMFKVNITHGSAGGKVCDLVLKGTNPTASAVQFTLYNTSVGNANWISLPLDKTTLSYTKDLGAQIGSLLTAVDGDSILVHKWDNSKQQLTTTTGDYDSTKGWIWDLSTISSGVGEPFVVNLSSGTKPFSVKTKF